MRSGHSAQMAPSCERQARGQECCRTAAISAVSQQIVVAFFTTRSVGATTSLVAMRRSRSR